MIPLLTFFACATSS